MSKSLHADAKTKRMHSVAADQLNGELKSDKEYKESAAQQEKDFQEEQNLPRSMPYCLLIENNTDEVQKIKLFGNIYKAPKHKEGVIVSHALQGHTYNEFMGQIASSPFICGCLYMTHVKGSFEKIKKYTTVMTSVFKDADGSREDTPVILNVDPYQAQGNILTAYEEFPVNAQTVLKFKLPPESSIQLLVYPAMSLVTGTRYRIPMQRPVPVTKLSMGQADHLFHPDRVQIIKQTDKIAEVVVNTRNNENAPAVFYGRLKKMKPVERQSVGRPVSPIEVVEDDIIIKKTRKKPGPKPGKKRLKPGPKPKKTGK